MHRVYGGAWRQVSWSVAGRAATYLLAALARAYLAT
jgi:hypothetical protein